ncbi:LINE-1 retrotransposable element ORF1 protein [Plecturocebus cupreus]
MKEKMLRAAREKARVTHKGKPIRLTADLSAETLQARREWGPTFNILKEKNFQPRISYPAKLSFISEGKIKFFANKQVLRDYITTRPALQELLKETLHMDGNNQYQPFQKHTKRKGKTPFTHLMSITSMLKPSTDNIRRKNYGGVQWLMPIIPELSEAEAALWEDKVGGSPMVRSSRPAWSTQRNPVSTKTAKISQASSLASAGADVVVGGPQRFAAVVQALEANGGWGRGPHLEQSQLQGRALRWAELPEDKTWQEREWKVSQIYTDRKAMRGPVSGEEQGSAPQSRADQNLLLIQTATSISEDRKFLIIHLLKPNSDDSSHSFSIKPCSVTDEELASSVGEAF